jgi:serine protease Do
MEAGSMFSRALSFMLIICVAPATHCVFAQWTPLSEDVRRLKSSERVNVSVIEKVEPSVVAIARIKKEHEREDDADRPRRRFLVEEELPDFPEDPEFEPNEFGAGIIISPQLKGSSELGPWILTRYHLVQGGPIHGKREGDAKNRIFVYVVDRDGNRRGFDAAIWAADPRSDFAVLKLDFAKSKFNPALLQPIEIGDATGIKKGRLVFTFGNPYAIARDGSPSVSRGMISNVSRYLDPVKSTSPIHYLGDLLHIDSRLELGTSGGAVVDLDGQLIGMTSSRAALDGYEKSMGFAIAFNANTKRIIEDLCSGFEIDYGYIGIEVGNVKAAELRVGGHLLQYKIPGKSKVFRPYTAAKVDKVYIGSPANDADLKQEDVILQVNGRIISSKYDLIREVGLIRPGDKARLFVWRIPFVENRPRYVDITVGKWPVPDDENIIASRRRYSPSWHGLVVDYPTARQKFLRQSNQPDAVLVTEILTDRAAGELTEGQLNVGDYISRVNGRVVTTPREFHDIARNANELRLKLYEGGPAITIRKP